MTGNRLCVKAAVCRIVIFTTAFCTQRKLVHRRVRAVVRNAAYDRETRAAMRAIRERITKAARKRIKRFGAAGFARCGVWHDACVNSCGLAFDDLKIALQRQFCGNAANDFVHTRERRSLCLQGCDELLDVGRTSASVNVYAVAVVRNRAANVVLLGETPDGRTKAYTLHKAAHRDVFGDLVQDLRGRFRHSATSSESRQSKVRLLPESHTRTVLPAAIRLYGQHTLSRIGKPQRLSPLA